jgi:TPR repeat protein
MITLFLSFAFALAAAPEQTTLPSSPTPEQETVKRQSLSLSEISQLRTKAEAGDSSAQRALGTAYWTGNGVLHSDETAATWFRKAADQGDADAENSLGTMYRMGEGVAKDRDEALRWYHKAARDGSAAAMFNLGAAYYNGDGVNIDDVTSCAWFLLAQEAGYPQADDAVSRATTESPARPIQASEKIGEMYGKGGELPKNPSKALMWYRKASDGGAPEAGVNVAGLLVNGRNPTPTEFAEARKRCEDAANLNYSPGAYCMAVIYRTGLGVAKDPAETAKWLMRAADLGHPQAILQLGEAYWKADGVKPDPVNAYMWILLAYRSRVPGAEQDEERIRKEMSAKDIEKAKKKADTWAIQHRGWVVRTNPSDGSSR